MKGIRETAMSPEPEKPEYQDFDYPESRYRQADMFGGPYGQGQFEVNPRGYKDDYLDQDPTPNNTKSIIMSMIVTAEEVGDVANENDARYDETKAQIKAQEIAEEKLDHLAKAGYRNEYEVITETTDGFTEWEITFTLTKI
jgi:hypothetical protein